MSLVVGKGFGGGCKGTGGCWNETLLGKEIAFLKNISYLSE